MQEGLRQFREHGVSENVLLALGESFALGFESVHFVFQQIRRAAGYNLVIADRIFSYLFIDLARCLAVMTEQVVLDFIGDGFVAYSSQDVQHGLGADDLRSGRDQWRVAHVFAHARDFVQHFIHAAERIQFLELIGQVGDHAARNMIDQHARVNSCEGAFELPVFLAHIDEIGGNFL